MIIKVQYLFVIGIVYDEKLKKEEIQEWNKDYYELLEYRKKESNICKNEMQVCLLSSSNDDPIFIDMEKVFVRIEMKHY